MKEILKKKSLWKLIESKSLLIQFFTTIVKVLYKEIRLRDAKQST